MPGRERHSIVVWWRQPFRVALIPPLRHSIRIPGQHRPPERGLVDVPGLALAQHGRRASLQVLGDALEMERHARPAVDDRQQVARRGLVAALGCVPAPTATRRRPRPRTSRRPSTRMRARRGCRGRRRSTCACSVARPSRTRPSRSSSVTATAEPVVRRPLEPLEGRRDRRPSPGSTAPAAPGRCAALPARDAAAGDRAGPRAAAPCRVPAGRRGRPADPPSPW